MTARKRWTGERLARWIGTATLGFIAVISLIGIAAGGSAAIVYLLSLTGR